jgi:hypothetical protein
MTYDKMIHYIDNDNIVDTINECNRQELEKWLQDMNDHMEIMGYTGKNTPISLVAERNLINSRLV